MAIRRAPLRGLNHNANFTFPPSGEVFGLVSGPYNAHYYGSLGLNAVQAGYSISITGITHSTPFLL